MHVVRHNHVSHQQEFVALTNLPQRVYEEVSRPDRVEQRQPPMATKREEMQMAAAVVALQSFRHKTTPPRVRPTRGAPSFHSSAVNSRSGILSSMRVVNTGVVKNACATRLIPVRREGGPT